MTPVSAMTVQSDSDNNTVYIGNKPVYSYIMACMTQLESGSSIVLKARGRAITRAVDVAEVLTKRFLSGKSVITNIEISTEQLKARDGRQSNVSAIEITVSPTEPTE